MMATQTSERATIIGVVVIILGGVAAGVLLGRQAAENVDAPSSVSTSTGGAASTRRLASPAAAAHASAAPAPKALSEAELATLADSSMSGSNASRLAAIERLSHAPRDQALPPLKRVLLNGDPATDRPAALLALRELALAQGDDDQRIREAIREVIYHGDDADFGADAQEAIDIISGPKPE